MDPGVPAGQANAALRSDHRGPINNGTLCMKRLTLLLILLGLAPGCFEPRRPETLPPIEVYFSPHGGCTDAVVGEIEAAKAGILVQAYSFTSAPIAKALVDAHKRRVPIEVILDESQATERYSSADFLAHAGIPVRIDARHAIAHNKVMVIDGEVVITGSFNFTKQAEQSNAENLLVIRDKTIAGKYTRNWEAHAEHSEPYERKDMERGRREPRRRRLTDQDWPKNNFRTLVLVTLRVTPFPHAEREEYMEVMFGGRSRRSQDGRRDSSGVHLVII